MGAAAGVARGARPRTRSRSSMRSASPAAWPPASSNISPKAPGPSGCIPAGRRSRAIRAALLARGGFLGPRTVFEGVHGLFHGFAHTTQRRLRALLDDFGERWVIETLAFKPYPCGTMAHPYIDCARRLAARGIKADDIKEMVCEVGEGTVHRLWEPLAAKQRPPNGYAAKFATPFLLASRLRAWRRRPRRLHRRGRARPGRAARSPRKVRYVIDPNNPYPNAFTGHIRAVLNDGSVIEERQPHFRGGAQRAADARRHRGEIRAQCAPRRLGRGAQRRGAEAARETLSMAAIDLTRVSRVSKANGETKELPAKSRSSPAPAAISAAPSRSRSPLPAPRGGQCALEQERKPTASSREIEAARRQGGGACSATSPIRRPSQAMADAALKAFGRIDILVNNAALRREKADRRHDLCRLARGDGRDPRRRRFTACKACLPALKQAAAARSSTSAA